MCVTSNGISDLILGSLTFILDLGLQPESPNTPVVVSRGHELEAFLRAASSFAVYTCALCALCAAQ